MLGKLIKYEWKNTYKVGGVILITMLITTVLCWLSFQSPMWQSAFNGTDYERNIFTSPIDMLAIMMLVLYVLMLAGASYAIMIYLAVHFYKTMYTDEGYLTHTLPVNKHHILISKIFVGGIWSLIVSAAIVISVFCVIFGVVSPLVEPTSTDMSFWEAVGLAFKEIRLELQRSGMMGQVAHLVISLILTVVVTPFGGMAIIYGAISIGQLFKKHRVMMAIVAYIGICIVNYIISMLIQIPMTLYVSETDNILLFYALLYDAATLLNVAVGGGLYFLSHHVITKRLNME